MIFERVCRGSITSSMNPRPAGMYGFANFARYSSISSFRRASGSAAFAISSRYTTFAAASGPATAISAVGHA